MVVSRDVGHARFSTMGCCSTSCSSLSQNFIRFPIISHKRRLRSRTQAAVSALRSRTQAAVSAICMRDFSLRGKLRRAARVLCRASTRQHDLCQTSKRHHHHYHIIHHQIILHIFVLWSHCASSTYIRSTDCTRPGALCRCPLYTTPAVVGRRRRPTDRTNNNIPTCCH